MIRRFLRGQNYDGKGRGREREREEERERDWRIADEGFSRVVVYSNR
jgi:hypothetical protein